MQAPECRLQSSWLTGDGFMIRSKPIISAPFAKAACYMFVLCTYISNFIFHNEATQNYFHWCRPKLSIHMCAKIADAQCVVSVDYLFLVRRQYRNLLEEISVHRCGTMDASCRNLTKVFFFSLLCSSFPIAIVHICQRWLCVRARAYHQSLPIRIRVCDW